jgi:hypothetical protein
VRTLTPSSSSNRSNRRHHSSDASRSPSRTTFPRFVPPTCTTSTTGSPGRRRAASSAFAATRSLLRRPPREQQQQQQQREDYLGLHFFISGIFKNFSLDVQAFFAIIFLLINLETIMLANIILNSKIQVNKMNIFIKFDNFYSIFYNKFSFFN